MSHPDRHPAFPVFRAAILLTGIAAACWTIGLLLLPALVGQGEAAAPRVHAAALLAWSLHIASLIVIHFADPFGVKAFTATYFVSMFVKMAGVLIGARILIAVGWIESGKPLAISLAMMYLPLLAAEVAIIAIHLRKKFPSVPAAADAGAADGTPAKEVGA